MSTESEYVLGTDPEEIVRLGLQHRVWRPRALDAWRRAGLTVGQTILDVGCGPGYGSIDLAEIVGPSGSVIAVDKSRRFLEELNEASKRTGLTNISTMEIDLDSGRLPSINADAAWARWIFAFVHHPHDLLVNVAKSLKSGGIVVVHEYLEYATWRLIPTSNAFEEFVKIVMTSWRDGGGEPNIGLQLPIWLEDLGFEVRSLCPIVDMVSPANYVWEWPQAFVRTNIKRLVQLGYLTEERASEMTIAIAAATQATHAYMVTPMVVEIIARKP